MPISTPSSTSSTTPRAPTRASYRPTAGPSHTCRSEELREEIEAGIRFWGFEDDGILLGVMGLQDRGDVSLIRHAYVRSSQRNHGIGTRLLRALEATTDKPLLIGTWADATWALTFYQKNGYRLLSTEESSRLLHTYWSISERQVETSVVLASMNWRG